MINPQKICIIMCVNNPLYLEECFLYLNRLIIPDGFEVDILTISDAKSMTSGYNEGLNASDAKYKIYMHQDVFITDIYFLQELIDIFSLDASIGMVGIVGAYQMASSGIMWQAPREYSLYSHKNLNISLCFQYTKPTFENLSKVEVVDGLLIATQYDLPWREDLFTGWDFYDASQSMEFKRAGYSIVVPVFNKPLCVHDDGLILNLSNYDDYRKIFLAEYKKDLSITSDTK